MDDQNLTNSGTSPASDNSGQETASNSSNPAAGSGVLSNSGKKPKTEKQKERERERRRRRRRKSKVGKDVPLILNEQIADEKGFAATEKVLTTPPADIEHLKEAPEAKELEKQEIDAPIIPAAEQPVAEPEVAESEPEPESIQPEPIHEETLEEEPEPEHVAMPEPEIIPEIVEEHEPLVEEEPLEHLPEKSEDKSKSVFEEDYHPSDTDPVADEMPSDLSVRDLDNSADLNEHEENLAEAAKLAEAKRISENLVTEPDDLLEEVPVKKDILGRIFDFIAARFEKKEPVEKIVETEIKVSEDTGLEEPKSQSGFFWGVLKRIGSVLALLAILVAAFWFGASLHLVDTVTGWFKTQPGLELTQGTNEKVNFDADMIRKMGFYTGKIFGGNGGDQRARSDVIFFNAYYFGKLKDPVMYGETGFTAGIYYGFRRDEEYAKNKFIYYVRYLAKIRNANQIDILASLNGKTDRTKALDTLTEDFQTTFDDGNKLRKEINMQIDDMKISYNSLTPEKERYEGDFFNAMEKAEAEKADLLIDKFIESSQKQIELKAKLAALTQLSADYETDLIDLKLKLEGISKNRAALIEGITVTNVPGSTIDLVNN